MKYTVPTLSIVFMAIVAIIGIAIPVFLFLFFRKKYKAAISPFFIGCAIFIVFALIIEGVINSTILASPLGAKIKDNIWLYGIFGGLMAGIFEETGRFTAFKTFLKKKLNDNQNALMYGAGHGGFEAFLILTVSMLNNLVVAVTLNMGMSGTLTSKITDPTQLAAMNNIFATLAKTAPALFLLSVVERFAAVGLHIALSVLVWHAVKNSKKFWLFPLAIFLHAFVDAAAVILNGSGFNVGLVLAAVYITTAISIAIAVIVWRKNAAPPVVNEDLLT